MIEDQIDLSDPEPGSDIDYDTELKAWANGRKITGADLLADESWLVHVEAQVAEVLDRQAVPA